MQRASVMQQEILVIPSSLCSQPASSLPKHTIRKGHSLTQLQVLHDYCRAPPAQLSCFLFWTVFFQTLLTLSLQMAFLWDPLGISIPRPSPKNKMRFRFLKSYRYLFYLFTVGYRLIVQCDCRALVFFLVLQHTENWKSVPLECLL